MPNNKRFDDPELRRRYMIYVSSAKKTGIQEQGVEFNLSYEQFCEIVRLPCHYCGASPRLVSGKRWYTKRKSGRIRKIPHIYAGSGVPYKEGKMYTYTTYMNGIDRVDNQTGYMESNVVPCCKKCNLWKKAEKVEDFLDHAKQIAIHQNWTNGQTCQ